MERKFNKKIMIMVTVLVIICIVIFIAARVPERFGLLIDPASREGTLKDLSAEERIEKLQEAADQSSFAFRINGNMKFETGKSQGILFIENPEENGCLLKVKITLNQDGRTLYETGFLKPGTGIGKDRLDEELPGGEYEATAVMRAYNSNEEETGKAQAGIHITVRR